MMMLYAKVTTGQESLYLYSYEQIISVKVPSDEMIFSVERKNDKLRVVVTAKWSQ